MEVGQPDGYIRRQLEPMQRVYVGIRLREIVCKGAPIGELHDYNQLLGCYDYLYHIQALDLGETLNLVEEMGQLLGVHQRTLVDLDRDLLVLGGALLRPQVHLVHCGLAPLA